MMKRRDFIKGLVAAPVVLKGIESVGDGVRLYSTSHGHDWGEGLAPGQALNVRPTSLLVKPKDAKVAKRILRAANWNTNQHVRYGETV